MPDHWAVTMYDKDGFQVSTPINRFASDDAFKWLVIQREYPGPASQLAARSQVRWASR